MQRTLDAVTGPTLAIQLAATIREARQLIGWSQRELAERAGTSQSTICRLEAGGAGTLGLGLVERVLAALGLRPRIGVDDRHLADRRRQNDGVHAVTNGYGARHLERDAWLTASEVELGDGLPRGWIDLLGFRWADRALLIGETKTDLPDMGGLQRSLAFYEREAWAAARKLGWEPRRSAVLVLALDSASMARRLADNRELVTRAFPARIPDVAAWLRDPAAPPPHGWALGMCDPASREANWLRPTMLGSRRRPPAYEDYAAAARALLRS